MPSDELLTPPTPVKCWRPSMFSLVVFGPFSSVCLLGPGGPSPRRRGLIHILLIVAVISLIVHFARGRP
jgi:hypothetical protein